MWQRAVLLDDGACKPACAFDAVKLSQCPVWRRGTFAPEPLAEQELEPLPQACHGHAAGRWVDAADSEALRSAQAAMHSQRPLHEWQAATPGCAAFPRWHRATCVRCLRGERLLFLGDSMVRQLFYSLVGLARVLPVVVDYDAWVPAYYLLSDTDDEFGVVPWANHTEDLSIYLRATGSRRAWRRGARRLEEHATVQYTVAPTFGHILDALKTWLAALPAGVRFSVVLGPMFWEQKPSVPQSFLATLEHLLRHEPRLRKLLLLGTPSARLTKRKKEWQTIIPERNAKLAKWVDAQQQAGQEGQEKVAYLDYDSMSLAAAAALPQRSSAAAFNDTVPGVADGNWHYQCYLHWRGVADHQFPSEAEYKGAGQIFTLQDGSCTDEMNRALLRVIHASICSHPREPA